MFHVEHSAAFYLLCQKQTGKRPEKQRSNQFKMALECAIIIAQRLFEREKGSGPGSEFAGCTENGGLSAILFQKSGFPRAGEDRSAAGRPPMRRRGEAPGRLIGCLVRDRDTGMFCGFARGFRQAGRRCPAAEMALLPCFSRHWGRDSRPSQQKGPETIKTARRATEHRKPGGA